MVAGTGLATTRRFKAATSSSSASRRSSTFRAYAPRLSVVRLNPSGRVSGLADQSTLASGSRATRDAPPPTPPFAPAGAGAGALSNARLLVLSLGDSGAVGGMNPPWPYVSISLLRFASRAARSSSSAAASAPRLRPSCLSQPPFLAVPSLALDVATRLCSAAALARSAASPAPSSTARRTGLALNLGAAAIASSSSSSVVFARARPAAFDLLSAGDFGFVGALLWKLLLSSFGLNVSFLNVCATDLNGEFSSRAPCATTARVAMRCVLANEGVVGLVDGFAGATRPGPLLAAARLAATRMRSFSSAAAARLLQRELLRRLLRRARPLGRPREVGRDRDGELGGVRPEFAARTRGGSRRVGTRRRGSLALALGARDRGGARGHRAGRPRRDRGGNARNARAAGFSATGSTEAPTRRGLAGDIALLSPVASSR